MGTTPVYSKKLGRSREEEGELGSRSSTKLDEGVTYMGAIKDEGKFKVTRGSTNLGGGETLLNYTSRQMMTPWVYGSNNL